VTIRYIHDEYSDGVRRYMKMMAIAVPVAREKELGFITVRGWRVLVFSARISIPSRDTDGTKPWTEARNQPKMIKPLADALSLGSVLT
jgi:hypothetical protein